MKKNVPALVPVLILISALFLGILVFTYVETKRANPQMIHVGASGKPLRQRRGSDPSRARRQAVFAAVALPLGHRRGSDPSGARQQAVFAATGAWWSMHHA